MCHNMFSSVSVFRGEFTPIIDINRSLNKKTNKQTNKSTTVLIAYTPVITMMPKFLLHTDPATLAFAKQHQNQKETLTN